MVNMLTTMLQALLIEFAGVGVFTGVLYLYWNAMTKKSK